jgi:hypothetical protein
VGNTGNKKDELEHPAARPENESINFTVTHLSNVFFKMFKETVEF